MGLLIAYCLWGLNPIFNGEVGGSLESLEAKFPGFETRESLGNPGNLESRWHYYYIRSAFYSWKSVGVHLSFFISNPFFFLRLGLLNFCPFWGWKLLNSCLTFFYFEAESCLVFVTPSVVTAFFNIIIFIKSWCMEHIRSASVHYGSGSKVLEMTLTKHRFVAESPLINIKVAKLFYRASVA